MKIKQKIFFILLIIFIPGWAFSQITQSFTLDEAIKYALEKNYEIQNADYDIAIAKKRVSENAALGLPQISAGLTYNYYFSIPTQIIPDFISPAVYGVLYEEDLITEIPPDVGTQSFEAQFGTKNNVFAQLEASQLIFSGVYFVGLKAARAYLELIKENRAKTESQIIQGVTEAYYSVLVAQESKLLLDSTISNLIDMLEENREMLRVGFIEDTDVDQLELLVNDVEANIINVDRQLEISYNFLKFQMGLSISEIIELSDDLESLITRFDADFLLKKELDTEENVDYRLLKKQEALSELQLKLTQAGYLPMINAYYSYQQAAQRQDFDFFKDVGQWYPTNMLGIQLSIPITTGGNRHHKISQQRLELEKLKVSGEQLEQSLKLQVATARNNLENAYLVYLNKKKSMESARRIYDKTSIKYKEGVTSSLSLAQAYEQLLNTQQGYINAKQFMLQAKTEVDRLFYKTQ